MSVMSGEESIDRVARIVRSRRSSAVDRRSSSHGGVVPYVSLMFVQSRMDVDRRTCRMSKAEPSRPSINRAVPVLSLDGSFVDPAISTLQQRLDEHGSSSSGGIDEWMSSVDELEGSSRRSHGLPGWIAHLEGSHLDQIGWNMNEV